MIAILTLGLSALWITTESQHTGYAVVGITHCEYEWSVLHIGSLRIPDSMVQCPGQIHFDDHSSVSMVGHQSTTFALNRIELYERHSG